MIIDLPLPDARARSRIQTDLDANVLVEAGAGSGKTTALVARMVELVRTGTAEVGEIAAVTFTRKAAGELRERFQSALEAELRRAREGDDGLEAGRLSSALSEIDRAFVGTIHSFCARLLRERPLEVGLDPGFEELPVEERAGLRRRFWEAYLERLARDSDPILEELTGAGVRPVLLFGLFDKLVENPDVVFPAEVERPPSVADVDPIREALGDIVDRGWELMDDHPPPAGWDSLQKKIRRLHFEREVTGWNEPADLFGAFAALCRPASSKGHTTTLNRWRDKELGRAVKDSANEFGHGDTPAQRVVDQWYAYRYALALRLGQSAADAFAEHRRRVGKLDFQDLLVLAARLLRTDPDVRRQLGGRYRRLLVDEFQDTDPLQAEIMLLLSSEPTEPNGGGHAVEADWRSAVPRPGALFVVGDPKQSIYRFRRADIQLYGFVRDRFAEFGDVVTLSSNFRSRPRVGDLVNELFLGGEFFPEHATPVQAAFERLATRPPEKPVPGEGVFAYTIDPHGSRKDEAAFDDAARIAGWIRSRVDAGERQPADFLILTRGRARLAVYARTLESYGLPVQVTGAGVGVEDELRELGVLLSCMIDPTDPVKVLAALVGLFFGIDYERLVEHRLGGGSLDAMSPGDAGHPDVTAALRRLHGWWRASIAEPADVFIGRMAHDLGLLPLAAAGELGSIRAGAFLYAMDAVRAAALAGDASLPGALEAIDAALELTEAEAPLEPGRPDAVRLMNLHQAKGLEGRVVILADPTDKPTHRPDMHVLREDDGSATGYLRVTEAASTRWGTPSDLARPVQWTALESAEERFERAEEVRLLYVAVTRAMEELVVARWPEGKGSSAWEPLDAWLVPNAEPIDLPVVEPLPRESLEAAPADVAASLVAIGDAIHRSGFPGYRHVPVTELAKGSNGGAERGAVEGHGMEQDRRAMRGFSWGSAVHGALAFALAEPPDEALRAACRNLLVENQRPVDDHGEPVELDELIELTHVVRASELWARARASDRYLAEIPFALPDVVAPIDDQAEPEPEPEPETPTKRQLDLFGSESAPGASEGGEPAEAATKPEGTTPEGYGAEPRRVLEGVIDLAFREDGGWVIADYKTDVGTDPDFPTRERAYRRQVELYADAWGRLTGESVKERVLFFTAQGRVERW